MTGWKWVILVAVCAATVGHAYDPGMHVWLGENLGTLPGFRA
jgi:hypothetical protein